MSNYPPGVTGNEPQITGEWPCDVCGGCGYEEDEDGKHPCPLCDGSGITPEDAYDVSELQNLIKQQLDYLAEDIEFDEIDDKLVVYFPYEKIDGWYKPLGD